jgi:endonuclease/exonuclease/phosphatase family metal-dependent hydrolase
VLLGDLNLPPDAVEPALAAAGYLVAFTGPTFPVRTPRTRIDYVAVEGLRLVSAEVLETPLSDHRAVVAVAEGTDPAPG